MVNFALLSPSWRGLRLGRRRFGNKRVNSVKRMELREVEDLQEAMQKERAVEDLFVIKGRIIEVGD